MKTTFTIKGMHCTSCKVLIEDACSDIHGVQSCKVDYKAGIAVIEHNANVSAATLKKEIEKLGEYTVRQQA
ncbi:heavy-metal-associated domain-containing protein [Candidatus Woesearchaeota archaeon]|nr:heavy-metal-associated domain-containing protein [Candidatus Woesearchaeota archaeon]